MVQAIVSFGALGADTSSRVRAVGAGGFGVTLRSVLTQAAEPAMIEAAGRPLVATEKRRDDRRDRAARQNASALLDELERVQGDLLRSRVPTTRLRRLAMMAAQMTPDDGDLAEICTAIALRARVEAARLERAGSIKRQPARDFGAPRHS